MVGHNVSFLTLESGSEIMYVDCDYNPYQGNPTPSDYLIFDNC